MIYIVEIPPWGRSAVFGRRQRGGGVIPQESHFQSSLCNRTSTGAACCAVFVCVGLGCAQPLRTYYVRYTEGKEPLVPSCQCGGNVIAPIDNLTAADNPNFREVKVPSSEHHIIIHTSLPWQAKKKAFLVCCKYHCSLSRCERQKSGGSTLLYTDESHCPPPPPFSEPTERRRCLPGKGGLVAKPKGLLWWWVKRELMAGKIFGRNIERKRGGGRRHRIGGVDGSGEIKVAAS